MAKAGSASKPISTSKAKQVIKESGRDSRVPANPTPNTEGERGNVEYPMPQHTPGS